MRTQLDKHEITLSVGSHCAHRSMCPGGELQIYRAVAKLKSPASQQQMGVEVPHLLRVAGA